jgi:hypothetical protein
MLEFGFPDLDRNEVILEPELRTLKGSENATALTLEQLRGRLRLGTPVAVTASPAAPARCACPTDR